MAFAKIVVVLEILMASGAHGWSETVDALDTTAVATLTPAPTPAPCYTFVASQCECSATRIGEWSSSYPTAETCGAVCASTSGCMAFGSWTVGSGHSGYCALYDQACGACVKVPNHPMNAYNMCVATPSPTPSPTSSPTPSPTIPEGATLTNDLANEVIDNSETDLPPLWEVLVNTPSDRDVGTVTEHPIALAYELEVASCSLETAAEQIGSLPSIDIRRILVADTRNSTQPPPCYRTGCVGGRAVRHLNGMVNPSGATTVWGWQRNRYFALKAWMATKNSDDLIAVLASGEVLFAGCNESTIQEKYDLIIRANGGTGTIVLAAEVSPFHEDLGYSYDLRSTALDQARTDFLNDAEVNVHTDFATTHAACTTGFCNTPPKYQFANPGFIMGPVGDIEQMLLEMPQWADTENRLINQYYLRNPEKVALDYAGILVMSLHNMKLDTDIPVKVEDDAGGKTLRNKVTGSPVCFVHGAGNSFTKLKELALELLA